jgi:hypothetical protein
MEAGNGNLVVHESTCSCSSVHTVTLHHRNFPELAVEATTAARAVSHLERLLERALDYGSETWRREGLQQAVADVRRYASTLPSVGDLITVNRHEPEGSRAPRIG